jgi:hypothetical protein
MKAKQGTLIVYPNYIAGMLGVWAYFKTANDVTLKYTDGSEEYCLLSQMKNTDWSNAFSVVSGVQALREKREKED